MSRILIFLSFICFVSISIQLSAQRQGNLSLELDAANFRYDDENNFVELYYSFSRVPLTIAKQETGFTGSVLMRSTIQDVKASAEPITRLWRVPLAFTDTTQLQNALVGRVGFVLSPGEYMVSLIAHDEVNASINDTARIHLKVSLFSRMQPSFSDLELSTSIRQIDPDSNNIFYKNTFEIIPNPSLVFGHTSPVLMHYAELYQCDLPAYSLKTEIINSFGKTVFEKKRMKIASKQVKEKVGTVDYGAIPIHLYPSNFYTFVLTLQDTLGKAITSRSKKFYIYNPRVQADSTLYAGGKESEIDPAFTSLSENEVDKEFLQANYIATKEEKLKYNSLTGSEPKKKFLTQFWKDRDFDGSTPENEYRREYLARILYCNRTYRTAYREGWQTDRGRVYVMYGKPDAIERHASEGDTRPYEVWTFDQIEAGVQFVFVDRFGFNNYELVHSTKRNEIRDDEWQRFIKTAN